MEIVPAPKGCLAEFEDSSRNVWRLSWDHLVRNLKEPTRRKLRTFDAAHPRRSATRQGEESQADLEGLHDPNVGQQHGEHDRIHRDPVDVVDRAPLLLRDGLSGRANIREFGFSFLREENSNTSFFNAQDQN